MESSGSVGSRGRGLRNHADGQITEAQSKLITILAWVVSRDGST